MSKEKNLPVSEKETPEKQGRIPLWTSSIIQFIKNRKKLSVLIVVLLLGLVFFNLKSGNAKENPAKSINVTVDKSLEFSALNNQGKTLNSKVRLKIATAEKTNKVLVKDQVFTAKNNKLFLILNLELKNDATNQVNILPGDLIRLSIEGDEDNKFAPDLHNNLVLISALSTKNDRIGFVIPTAAKKFNLYIGELDGKKEAVAVNFPT